MNSEAHPFELGKNRIEALSDGVFAIVMTILVFNFKVPELPADAQNVQLTPALLALWPKFVTYGISFLSLGVFWIGHHMMYHTIQKADRTLLWLNIFFFMFVSILPFSASVVDAFLQTQIAPLFFGANIAMIGWLLVLQWVYASHQPDMMAPFVTPEFRTLVKNRILLAPAATTLTMLICFWSVEISLVIYLLVLPLYMLPGKLARVNSRGLQPV